MSAGIQYCEHKELQNLRATCVWQLGARRDGK